ncbi:MAG: IPT/TIG domain-containing protein, partial [Candidatus Dormiibacterota bacterium]
MKRYRSRAPATLVALAIALGLGTAALAVSSGQVMAAGTQRGAVNLAPSLTIQDKHLDCEAAALAAAFQVRSVAVDTGGLELQDWIFDQLPLDLRNPVVSGVNVTWGDPFVDFVGNVNGVEGFAPGDGYGVYYPPIANIVTKVGYAVQAHMGWTTASIEAAVESGSPVVVWIDFRSLASGVGYGTSTWTAFDGRTIPYTLHEHAVTVLGAYPGHSITLLDVFSGSQYTYTEAQFTSMIATFGGMGVAVGPSTVVPPAFPVVSSLSPAAGPVTGGQTVTVSGTGFDPAMTVSLGGAAVTPADVTSTSFTMTTPAAPGGYAQLKVTNSAGSNQPGAGSGYVYAGLSKYVALAPFRILDTRAGSCVQCGSGRLTTSPTRTLQITGVAGLRGGADPVPAAATAVVINVTAISSTTGGLLTIYPTGTGRPRASNLNFGPRATTPNLVTVALGQADASDTNREVNIYNPIGSVDVVADVEGYFVPGTRADPTGEFHGIAPLRVCDTRAHQPANVCNGSGATDHRLGPRAVLKVNVAGVPSGVRGAPASIPTNGTAQAAVLNLTAIHGTSGTYLSVFPPQANGSCAASAGTSTINLVANTTEANRVIVSLGPAATGGPTTDVCVYNAVGSIDFILDASGWFGSGTAPVGTQFQAIGPTRVCDTRAGSGTPCAGHTLTTGATLLTAVAGIAGVPHTGPVAVIGNLTAISFGSGGTYLTAYPADASPRPNASDVNVVSSVLPNLVVVGLSQAAPAGDIRLFNASGSVSALLDVDGWFQ